MELLRKHIPVAQVLTNKSLYELAEIVLQDAGLTNDEYIIDSAQDIVVPYAWFGLSAAKPCAVPGWSCRGVSEP